MIKKKDPEILLNYRFLSKRIKQKINKFVDMLNEPYREFAVKRYLEGKTFSQVAEEMMYSERSLYNLRDEIITWWEIYYDQKFEKDKLTIIRLISRHGNIEHWRLRQYTKTYVRNFDEIIKNLISTGKIVCNVSRGNHKGRPARNYMISNN